jgi:ribosome-associated toxin RatA of RatAB toxin-antitoxin module
MRLEDSIVIDCPKERLYAMASDVEHHAQWLPGYLESRVVEQRGGGCVLQREAIIIGQRRRWKSLVEFDPGQSIYFTQLEGPLQGMRVTWMFDGNSQNTIMRIVHDVHVRPWWKKWWMERWVARPAIEQTARGVLEAFKCVAETRPIL